MHDFFFLKKEGSKAQIGMIANPGFHRELLAIVNIMSAGKRKRPQRSSSPFLDEAPGRHGKGTASADSLGSL